MTRRVVLAIAFFSALGGWFPAVSSAVDLRVCVLVVDAADLSPLADSTVVLRPMREEGEPGKAGAWVPSGEPSISLATDAEGAACAERLPPGHYVLEVSKPGFWMTRSEPFWILREPAETPTSTTERMDVRIGLAARWATDADRFPTGSAPEASEPRPPKLRLRLKILEEATAPIPGVTVMLTPVSGTGPESDEAWLTCEWSRADDCGAIAAVTRGGGGVCFEDLPAGRYRVRAQLEGFWETEIGPIEVPPSDFEQVRLPIALELNWAWREENFVSLCDGWPDMMVVQAGPPRDDCP